MTAGEASGEGTKGTYILSIELPRMADISVGSLGEVHFDPGYYAYVGSAFGPGGFSRLDRHRAVASGNHEVRHWHIDYLLGEESVTLSDVQRLAGRDCECALATRLGESMIADFGASDCQCRSHLAYHPTAQSLQQAVADAIQHWNP